MLQMPRVEFKHPCNGGVRVCLRAGSEALQVLAGRAVARAQPPAQPGLDKRVEVAIEDGLRIADLEPRALVLHERAWLQHVLKNLRPELVRHHLPANLLLPARGLTLLGFGEARL